GGKDSALALHRLQQRDDMTVDHLLTTVSSEHDRVSIHGVRRELLERQAEALDLPLHVVELPAGYSNEDYDRRMMAYLDRQDVSAVVYADIFLEDVRRNREEKLQETGMDGVWPLWGEDTAQLARAFIDAGFEATLVCVDADRLDRSFAGRRYDRALLEALPEDVDPCGEDGAFHTFVHGGPPFQRPLTVERGAVVTRDVAEGAHHYCDLRPGRGGGG
ncbi:MAG: ATP-binding protein, partial [Candidatus Nanohaloarchaea archaeon]|nr:ATP-binding protein [Candidatus Nanohaloarchaea archaeon]